MDVLVSGRKGLGEEGCWTMEMGGRAEDLEINVFFLFFYLFLFVRVLFVGEIGGGIE